MGATSTRLPYSDRVESALLYVLGVVIVLAGLVLSIGLHEVGHLLPAKRFGVRVGQYMIGFGPTIFSKKVGETEYGVKAIPLGGYISMAGMFPPARAGGKPRTASTGFFDTLVQDAREVSKEGVPAGQEDRVFYKLSVPKRIVIMLGGPVMNLLLAFVFFTIAICGFGMPAASTTVGAVIECALPATTTQTECEPGDPATPAAEAGMRPGDRLVSIDGVAITDWVQSTVIIRDSAGETLDVVVERDGAELTLEVTPLLLERYDLDDPTQVVEVGYLGIAPASELQPQPITEVPPFVWDTTVHLGELILTLPVRLGQLVVDMVNGEERDPNGPVSIVGVGRLAGEVTSLDAPVAERAATVISLLGGLNLALFLFNLLPLLPLDGGHVAGALIEAIRRGMARVRGKPDPGPIDTARFVPVTLVVTLLLGTMSIFLIVVDLVNPISLF